jgi:hypothetical protein
MSTIADTNSKICRECKKVKIWINYSKETYKNSRRLVYRDQNFFQWSCNLCPDCVHERAKRNWRRRNPYKEPVSILDRFLTNIIKNSNGCWDWTKSINSDGYGCFKYKGKNTKAHRVSLLLHGLIIPKGMFIDHICRNRKCVNPDHLRIVTPKQNALENSVSFSAINKLKTHCYKGHEFNFRNTSYMENGHRHCKECQRLRSRRRRSERREPSYESSCHGS